MQGGVEAKSNSHLRHLTYVGPATPLTPHRLGLLMAAQRPNQVVLVALVTMAHGAPSSREARQRLLEGPEVTICTGSAHCQHVCA